MAGGRPRQPDSLKNAKGTLQPSRVNQLQPKVLPGMPEIPSGLVGTAKRKFIELAKELSQMKVITTHDTHVLEQIAKEFDLFKQLEKILKKDGLFYHGTRTEKQTVDDPDGVKERVVKVTILESKLKTHPALTARNQAWTNIMKGLQECGLTPSTRSKLKIVKKEDSNPFSDFLKSSIS